MKIHLRQKLLMLTIAGFVLAFLTTGATITAAALPAIQEIEPPVTMEREEATPYSGFGGIILPTATPLPVGGVVTVPKSRIAPTQTVTPTLPPQPGGAVTVYSVIALSALLMITLGLMVLSALLLLKRGRQK